MATILIGLSTRWFPAVFPSFVARYGGDALWAAMVFWSAALIRPAAKTVQLAAIALTVSFAVELSQLARAPWLNAIRDTPTGALVLGQGFLWTDLVSYTCGVLLAATLDLSIATHRVRAAR